ncbi:MAG: hypothetical protein J07HN4v3_00839 [Halonotius sp. J07HN4]|nr:MAG: hypothetical protein J07HN4v3_00839 [Halonotius sp. J07HN4]
MPDVDSVYKPLVFYGSRAVIVGVTEFYAVVDRAVMATIAHLKHLGGNPQATARRFGFGSDEQPPKLRTGIGRGVFLLTALVAVVIVLLIIG